MFNYIEKCYYKLPKRVVSYSFDIFSENKLSHIWEGLYWTFSPKIKFSLLRTWWGGRNYKRSTVPNNLRYVYYVTPKIGKYTKNGNASCKNFQYTRRIVFLTIVFQSCEKCLLTSYVWWTCPMSCQF